MALFHVGAPAHGLGPLAALAQVVLIDLTLASDNVIAVGMAAAGLPKAQRRRAIALGLATAVVLLCTLAFFAVQLLKSGGGGLVLGGGLMLLLISRQMWLELQALLMIFSADVATSADNMLAVAGVARNQPVWVLIVGIVLSVAITGLAATQVARLLRRWPWVGYVGVAVVVITALRMILDGAAELGWLRL
jgi:YjbE family integral membrane protein